MHEYQITRQIIQTAEDYAIEHNASGVKVINLVVGEFSGCVADSIELYFDLIAKDTMCSEATLNIEIIKPLLKCKVCGNYFERIPFEFACTAVGCSGEGEPTEIGREFFIKSIEV